MTSKWHPSQWDSKSNIVQLHPASQQPTQEKKSFTPFNGNMFEFLHSSGYNNITSYQAINFYNSVSALAIGIDMRSKGVAGLELALWDNDDLTKEHPLLAKLNNPNMEQSGFEFLQSVASFYDIAGDSYLIATGSIARPPASIYPVKPQYIVGNENARDGIAETYQVTNSDGKADINTTFYREIVDGKCRYFTKDGNAELWHIKEFNPNRSVYGQSKLLATYYEIEQLLYSNQHNLSLLRKGGRVTGLLVTEGIIGDDEYARLQEQINVNIAGADNAGRILMMENGLKYQEMGKSNKDMDFLSLKKEVKDTIFNRLGIPLPLVSNERDGQNKYAESRLALYEDAILPLAQRILNEITLFLAPRYKLDPAKQYLTYDASAVEALQYKRNQQLELIHQTKVASKNEERAMVGLESMGPDGDKVYVENNITEVGTDQDTDTNLEEPEEQEAYKSFEAIMLQQVDVDGKCVYSTKDIQDAWNATT